MKKYLIIFLIALIAGTKTWAQKITPAQFQVLIGYLNNEDWLRGSQLSKSYLSAIQKDHQSDDQAAILRYMYLTCQSGLMNGRKINQEQALKSILPFKGLRLIFPWRQFSLKGGFNYIELADDKKLRADTLMVTSTNKAADMILSFEYLIPKKTFTLQQFKNSVGKECRMSGVLKYVRVDGHGLPRFNMTVDDAELIFASK
jgi:hypothetical protein